MITLHCTGFPVRSVDMQRATDNITVRQGDTAIIRLPVAVMALCTISVLFPRQETQYEKSESQAIVMVKRDGGVQAITDRG
ncbi:hypothetical protein PAMP_018900 [Pampus punctatissimus]